MLHSQMRDPEAEPLPGLREAMKVVTAQVETQEVIVARVRQLVPDMKFDVVRYDVKQPWYFQYSVNDPDNVIISLSAHSKDNEPLRLATFEAYDTAMVNEELNIFLDYDVGSFDRPKAVSLLVTPLLESIRQPLVRFFDHLGLQYVREVRSIDVRTYQDAMALEFLLRQF